MNTYRSFHDVVTISDIDFDVEYEVCPAEPDVGIPNDYIILHYFNTNADIMLTDDVETSIIDAISEKVFGYDY